MIINVNEIKGALDVATQMAEHYAQNILSGQAYPRSVDDLLMLSRDYLGKDINVYDLEGIPETSSIRGTFLALEDGNYEIHLSREPTKCKNRFVLCKEIFHVLLDDEEYRNMEIYEHLKEVSITFPTDKSTPGKSVVCEQIAECAAMEFLFPYEKRVEQINLYLSEPQPNHLEIAEYFMVPQYLVERYLSDSFMETLSAFSIIAPAKKEA